MRQLQPKVMFKAIPLILVIGGVFFGSAHPSLAKKFPNPGSAPSSNSSGGRRAMPRCQVLAGVASSPTNDPLSAFPAQVVVANSDPSTLLVQVAATPAQQAIVKLADAEGNDLYYTQFPLVPTTEAGSVTRLPLPKTAVTLAPGQSYRWSLGLVCNQTIDPNDPVFEGWL
ncbi:DUF928 domain-containing protein [Trichothermofontia sp.]